MNTTNQITWITFKHLINLTTYYKPYLHLSLAIYHSKIMFIHVILEWRKMRDTKIEESINKECTKICLAPNNKAKNTRQGWNNELRFKQRVEFFGRPLLIEYNIHPTVLHKEEAEKGRLDFPYYFLWSLHSQIMINTASVRHLINDLFIPHYGIQIKSNHIYELIH